MGLNPLRDRHEKKPRPVGRGLKNARAMRKYNYLQLLGHRAFRLGRRSQCHGRCVRRRPSQALVARWMRRPVCRQYAAAGIQPVSVRCSTAVGTHDSIVHWALGCLPDGDSAALGFEIATEMRRAYVFAPCAPQGVCSSASAPQGRLRIQQVRRRGPLANSAVRGRRDDVRHVRRDLSRFVPTRVVRPTPFGRHRAVPATPLGVREKGGVLENKLSSASTTWKFVVGTMAFT